MSAHLTDNELIDQVYGIAEACDHLRACESCAARLEAMHARKSAHAFAGEPAPAFFTQQHSQVLAKIENPRRSYRWVPALAAACLAVAGFFAYPTKTPVPPPHPVVAQVEPSDAQLYAEVYSMRESTEPTAASPIRALIQEQE
jgi:hypothetical protein